MINVRNQKNCQSLLLNNKNFIITKILSTGFGSLLFPVLFIFSLNILYCYDDKEQLISAETSTIKYEYTYDDRGNILTEKEYAVTVDGNGEKYIL